MEIKEVKKDTTIHSECENKRIIPPLDWNDMKSLKKSNYDALHENWTKIYVIQHNSGKVAELRAVSPIHACKLIGWRPRSVKILSETVVEKETSNDLEVKNDGTNS